MERNEQGGHFALGESDLFALDNEVEPIWPFSRARELHNIVKRKLGAISSIDSSYSPVRAAQWGAHEQRELAANSLVQMDRQLTEHIAGVEVEEFLKGHTGD